MTIACDQATQPTPVNLPVPLTSVRVQGLVIDADTEEPVAHARITTQMESDEPNARWSVVTTSADDQGRYVIETRLRENWGGVRLQVGRDGYGTASIDVLPRFVDEMVLPLYRSVRIRSGESIEFSLALDHYQCRISFNGNTRPCRRVTVEAAPGEQVELEIPDRPEYADVTLVPESEEFPPFGLRMITVTASNIWVFGTVKQPGRLRLTAREPVFPQ